MSSASKKLIQASGAVAGEAPDTGDDDFANVVLLLDGDGTSDDDNNTFTDSSTNGHTITETGSVVQGSFSPYGDNWSNYFDGSGDYITTPASSDFNYGYGDYCLEGWLNVSSDATLYSYWMAPISTGGDGNTETDAVSIYIGDGNSGSSVAGEVTVIVCNNAFRLYGGADIRGQWTHVAVTRESGTTRLFVNGQVTDSSTTSYNITNPADVGAYLGLTKNQTSYFKGHISNVRSVKGSAVYTSAFTPSTAPLTAISGTSLLTCQSNRFVDNSSNAHSITPNGDAKVTPFSPFKNDDARDITTDGGSAYFDGDYLRTPNSASLNLSSGDWTMEGWIYALGDGYGKRYVVLEGASRTFGLVRGNNNTFEWNFFGTRAEIISSTNSFYLNTWVHFALVSNSTNITLYIDGVSQGTTTNYPDNSAHYVTVAASTIRYSSTASNAYVSDLRIVRGTAVYTANFTPPTAPLTAITNTDLLLNFQDSGIYDRTGLNNIDTVGDAQIDTAVKKYGTGSLEFDGSGDYLEIPGNEELNFGSGDFTIEAWIYLNSLTIDDNQDRQLIFELGDNVILFRSVGGEVAYYNGASSFASTSTPLRANTWHHVALVRDSGTIDIYVDGVSELSNSDTTNFVGTGEVYIARKHDGGQPLGGYLDDFRITKGVARYTANFTPPTAALPKF